MNSDISNFRLGMYQSGLIPPKEINLDRELHLFEVANEYSSRTETGYYICHEGKPSVGLYGCKSMGISKIWSSKKVEQMTDSELRQYKKVLSKLRNIRDNARASVSSGKKIKKPATIDEPIIKASDHPVLIVEPMPVENKKTHKEPKWNDQEILNDRVARRFLKDCMDVSGKRSKIKTLKLINLLNADEAMPWYVYNKGKPIGSQHLWRILEKFDIHSEDIRFKNGTFKGFYIESFREAWRSVLALSLS
jgi:hypothetical protein